MRRRQLQLTGGVPALSGLLLFLSMAACYGANVSLPGGSLTVPGTAPGGASFVYTGTLTQADTIAFVQTGNPCLQTGSGYCTNGAGVLTVAGTGTPVGGSGNFSGTIGGFLVSNQTYGALMVTISGVGTRQVFSTNAANGLGSSTPPSSLTLPATSFSALGFSSFSVSNPTITFTVGDTDFSNNSGQFVLNATPVTTTMYGITGAAGAASSLYTVDAATGAATLIGPTGFSGISSLAFAPNGTTLYAVTGGRTHVLISIDRSTGVGTPIGATGLSRNVPDIAVRSDGVIFAVDGSSDMYTINPSTGVATLLGSTGAFGGGGALAFNGSGTLFLSFAGDLYTVNQTNGAATLVGTMDFSAFPSGTDRLAGMKFHPNTGVLYGTAFVNIDPPDSSRLVTANSTSGTIALTNIGDPGVILEAVAFGLPAPPPPPNGTVYGVTGLSGTQSYLYAINKATGQSTFLGYTGYLGVSSLDFSPDHKILYGVANDDRLLLSIDRSTGIGIPIGPTGLTSNVPDIAVRSDGLIFGVAARTSMYTFNPSTGTASLLGSLGIGSVGGGALAFDAQGTLYLFSGLGELGGLPRLFTVNQSTGAATQVATVDFSAVQGIQNFTGMKFDPNTGALYGTAVVSGSFPTSHLVRATVGGATVVFTDVGDAGTAFEALAFGPPPAQTTIRPDTLQTGTINVPYLQYLICYQCDISSNWGIASGSLPSGLTLVTQSDDGLPFYGTGLLSGTPTQTGVFTFTVQASANGPTQAYTMYVTNGPLSIVQTSLPVGVAGTLYSTTLTRTGGVPPNFLWSLGQTAPAWLSINQSTGQLTGTPPSGGTFQVPVIVQDVTGDVASRTFPLTILSNPVTITTLTIPSGAIGVPYSTAILASGGIPPYTWSLSVPSVNGISINSSTGVLSGTPVAGGNFSVTVQVSDSINTSGSATFTLNITDTVSITTTALPGAIVGVPFATTIVASGGFPPYTWSLPIPSINGLSINSTTGVVSGTPVSGGTISTFAVTVTDSHALKFSRTFTLNALSVGTSLLPDGTVGKTYSAALTAFGASPSISWSLTSGSSLPSGLSMNSSGVISGTPTKEGQVAFSVTVTDTQGSISKTLAINVIAGLTISTSTLPDGAVGTPYSAAILGSGGTGTLSFLVTQGSLPAGLALATGGTIAGTPTAAGLSNFTVSLTDSTNTIVQKALSITVAAAPVTLTITTGSLPGGLVNGAYAATLAASAASTWSIVTGSLPAGLSLNASTGAITGTPTAAGTATFTVRATSGANTAQKQFTIAVIVPPAVTVTGLPTSSGPGQQPAASVVLSNTYPLNVTGNLNLTFSSTAGIDNPEVRFSNGTRTASFAVAAGSTTGTIGGAPTIAVITGTVAGTISIALAATDSNGATIPPGQPITLVVTPTVPVISSIKVLTVSGGVNVVLTGFSTPRNMVSGLFHFVPTTGNALNPADVTVQLASAFATWYNSAASLPLGSQFSLTVPFTFQGGAAIPISAVTVTLTNSQGTSNPATGNP